MRLIERKPYGTMPDGTAVEQFTLSNAGGTRVRIITFGGIVTAIEVPDRNGDRTNVVLGCASLADYVADTAHFGALIGRYANRIARGRFTLDGIAYQLACNNPPNALHGGPRGFDKVVWQVDEVLAGHEARLKLRHRSPDGDAGYPGTLDVAATYTLTADNALRIDYAAATDKATVVNLTNHSYFNLAGEGRCDVYGHEVTILTDRFTPVDPTLIPTGEIRPVAGTPFDFRTAASIGERIRVADEQIILAHGFDHNFVLALDGAPEPRLAARVREPTSGRVLEVWTTQPGVQFYSGNFLDGTRRGSGGRPYRQSDGFCLETQHFPDSPNQPAFPSTVLRPGALFESTTLYRFPV